MILAWEPPGRLGGWGQSCSIPMLLSPVGVHCGPQGSNPSTPGAYSVLVLPGPDNRLHS